MALECRLAILGGKPELEEGPPPWPLHRPDVQEVLHQAFHDGSWGQYHGKYANRLVQQLKQYLQVEYVELCCSGTAAIELALRGVPVKQGDEVILAAYDFKGNFADVLAVGATPVLIDIEPVTCTPDSQQLKEAVSPRTKAIIVSHLHGSIALMSEIMAIAHSHGIPVIEDACQMPGAWVQGKRAGCVGDIGVISFGGSKLLTAGRGGAVFTNDARIAQRIHLHCQRGNHAYPLSELQAAVLLPQLQTLDAENKQRAGAVEYLFSHLEKMGLTPFPKRADSEPGYYKLGMWYDPERFCGLPREVFAAAVRAEGVALYEGFRGLHLTHSRSRYHNIGDLKHATDADRRVLVWHHPILLSQETVLQRAVRAFQKVVHSAEQLRHCSINVDSPSATR